MTHWQSVKISFANKDATFIEYVTHLLFELGAQGTEVKYAPGYLESHPNLFGEIPEELPVSYLEHMTEVYGYFEDEIDIIDLINRLESDIEGEKKIDFQTVKIENWQENWMEYYKVQHITRFIKIVPIWEDYQALNLDEKIIFLDPGIAFGTGDHPTTQLGAQALETVMRGNETVIDLGTGSGVLSFIAYCLGARKVWGYDLDPQAVEAAKNNLTFQPKINELIKEGREVPVEFAVNDLLQGININVDIIIANILPHILVEMFDDAYRLLNDSGYLVLGGILKEKQEEILSALDSQKWEVIQINQLRNWIGIILKKKGK
ncbi:50S ribosomal protein L11 methyltransferase [Facklamia sp. DSM 111018]|uniref:Ribosomal protein L11 methyltransferase n=1 Tax=Facklamia lactis TaxID=2749967 RepID=A0ABS0LPL4_9LACT|nr:50S ribosomal protein L11 methyltransferase [Facklamia lactis]MBG9980145.1 50S ribosomal protein L11 methyltransferase [Facklamia lactis]MBG9985947.1 50S ribosomal protein L11 methyltransferase [Facklamia lactis]